MQSKNAALVCGERYLSTDIATSMASKVPCAAMQIGMLLVW